MIKFISQAVLFLLIASISLVLFAPSTALVRAETDNDFNARIAEEIKLSEAKEGLPSSTDLEKKMIEEYDKANAKTPPVPQTFSVNKYLTLKGQEDLASIGGIGTYLVRMLNFTALAVASVAFVGIVIGAFILVSSAGLEAMVQRGKDIIRMSIIGLIAVLISYFIVSFAQSIFYEYGK
jgi:hypothetical protein